MTPEERELLEKLVMPFKWVDKSGHLDEYAIRHDTFDCGAFYVIKAVRHNDLICGARKRHQTVEQAKECCRTNHLEQVREILGDTGMAKLMGMKEALQDIVKRSHIDPLGTSKVIDMRNIAEKALEELK